MLRGMDTAFNSSCIPPPLAVVVLMLRHCIVYQIRN